MTKLEGLRRSARLNWEGLCYVRGLLAEGVSEWEMIEAFRQYTMGRGASKMAFDPIVGFGDHTAIPHHRGSDRKLKRGDPVTLDVGVILDGYASDCTRSFVFGGEEREMGRVVLEAFQLALTMCKPDVDFLDINNAVVKFFEGKGVGHLVKHRIGHGICHEVHEPPLAHGDDRMLREGIAITIEPGLYEDGKMGYRHEDTVIITRDGYEDLYEK